MYEKQVKINCNLNTVTAAQLVTEAKAFDADIVLTNRGKNANAKNLFNVETLGIVSGDTITVSADGPQAQQAVDRLHTFINQL
jgi:phosphocarrier protein HPr